MLLFMAREWLGGGVGIGFSLRLMVDGCRDLFWWGWMQEMGLSFLYCCLIVDVIGLIFGDWRCI